MNKDEQLYNDVGEMKRFLIGSEFDKKNCLSYRFDKVEDKVCVMQNQVNTLMQDREKQIEKAKEKAAGKVAFRKFLSAVTLGLIKMKTGL